MALVSTLERKLLREMARLRGQIATIAIVLAGGIICFIALRGTYTSIERSREASSTSWPDRWGSCRVRC